MIKWTTGDISDGAMDILGFVLPSTAPPGAYHIQSFRHLIRFLAFQNLYQLLKKTSDKKIFLRRIEYIPPIILKKISTYLFVFTYLRNKPTYNISSLETLKKFKIVSFKYCLSCLGENVIFDNPK